MTEAGHGTRDTEHANGVASPADIRAYAEALQWGADERVVLPKSGFAVILRRPTRMYFLLRQSKWTPELRQKIEAVHNGDESVVLTDREIAFLNREADEMIAQGFVNPKPSLTPDFNQFDPRWLPDEDRNFLKAYFRGQVVANGDRLDTFRPGERESVETGGGAGQDVRPPADGDSGAAHDGVGD
jgi:hypothetical protein